MKKVMLAAAAVLGFAGAASAQELSFFGTAEYQFEAEAVEAMVGVDVYVTDQFTLTPAVSGVYDGAFAVDSLSVTGTYDINANLAVYGRVEVDDSFAYQEAAIGASFRF